MKMTVLSLFPGIFEGFLNESIIKRARERGLVDIEIVNFRDYTPLKNGQVDDSIYGGGPGMLLRCEPIFECLDVIKTEDAKVVMLTPEGRKFDQACARELKDCKHLILLCGHYEGFDERIKTLVDEQISIGDFILTGGEIPAMAIIDAVTRLIPGAIRSESLDTETFEGGLLDYPSYTKPAEYRGMKVPDVLLSGDHAKIEAWREEQRLEKTREMRPDLME